MTNKQMQVMNKYTRIKRALLAGERVNEISARENTHTAQIYKAANKCGIVIRKGRRFTTWGMQ